MLGDKKCYNTYFPPRYLCPLGRNTRKSDPLGMVVNNSGTLMKQKTLKDIDVRGAKLGGQNRLFSYGFYFQYI